MRPRIALLAGLLALGALLLAPPAASTHEASGGGSNPSWIEARYAVDLHSDLATVDVNVTTLVHKAAAGASSVGARDLRNAYSAGGANDASVSSVRAAIDASFRSTIDAMFPDVPASDRSFRPTALDTATFEAASTGPYDPPVGFTAGVTLVLPVARTGLGYTAAQVDAVLAAGGRILVEHTFQSARGYDSTFVLSLPSGREWTDFESATSVSGPVATVRVNAVDAASSVTLGAGPRLKSHVGVPNAPRATSEDEVVRVDLAVGAFAGDGGIPVAGTIAAEFTAIRTEKRFPGALSSKVELPFLTASGIRTLYAAGVIRPSHVDSAVSVVRGEVEEPLNATFSGSAKVTARADASSLRLGATGPVRVLAFANATKDLGDATPAVVKALLEGGAVLRLDLEYTGTPGTRTLYALSVSTPGLVFVPASGLDLPDPATLAVEVDGRGLPEVEPRSLSARIRHPAAPAFDAQAIDALVTVDLRDLEVTLGGALGGDLGALLVDVEVRLELSVLEVPDEVASRLPDTVEIEFLPADTLRALRAAGGLNDSVLADLDARFLREVKANVGSLAPGIAVTGGIDRTNLAAAPASPPSTSPAVLSAKLSFRRAVSGGAVTPAALTLHEVTQTLEVKSVQDLATTYEVAFPPGLSIVAFTAGSSEVTLAERDGRDTARFTVPAGGSETATATIGVTPRLLWEEFPLVVLAASAIVVALVALPVWAISRAVRKG